MPFCVLQHIQARLLFSDLNC